MEAAIQILLIPATVIASVVLVVSCLFIKRFRRKKRNESSSVPDKHKSGKNKREENSQIKGETNTAFTVGNGEDIYEGDANVYDYAKNERGMETKGTEGQDKHSDISPVYADANDTTTRFYFTLERHPPETNADDDTYVVVIPENVYDKPENDTTMELNTGSTNIEGGSQFYYTLEECSEQSDKELSSPNIVPEGNEHSDIYDTTDEMCENGIQDDQMSYDGTYVINIPNENGMKFSETDIESEETIHAENEDPEQTYVVHIPNKKNDLPKVSPKMKADKSSSQIGIERDSDDGYSGKLGVDNVDRQKINSRSTGDQFGPKVDTYDSDQIYENVNACLYPNNKEHVPHNRLPEECSIHVKNATISEKNTANSQENLGYLDDEILIQNKTKENERQNAIDNESPYVIQVKKLPSDCSSENTTRNDHHCYFDDDIYEDWEDNIIGREKTVSGESEDTLNESGDVQNESGDEIYQNGNFDIIKEQDQYSACESFYENLRVSRPSLIMQDIR